MGNTIDRQTELNNCNFAKTVLMLLVVVYHSILYWSGSWFVGEPVYESKLFDVFSKWLNSFHIYGFVLISGYLFFFLRYEKGRYQEFWGFFMNKAKRLLVPYGFISVIWVIPVTIFFFRIGISDIFKNFLLGIAPGQLWFLLMLFGVFIMFYPLSSYFRKNDLMGGLFTLVLYGVGVIGASVIPNIFQIFRACMYLPFFWIGFKIRQYGSEFLRRISWLVWLVIDLVLFSVFLLVAKMDGLFYTTIRIGVEFLLHVVGAVMIFLLFQIIADRVPWKKSKLFALFQKCSMAVYLLHQQIIYFSIYWLNGLLNPYLHACFIFLVAITFSILIATAFMKNKWSRFLLGEK